MNLLDLGDPLIHVFAQMHQVDAYTFAFTCKRARRIVIAYARRPEACVRLMDTSFPWFDVCTSNGHILCAINDKRVLGGNALENLFQIKRRTWHKEHEFENTLRGAKLIISLFRRQFDDYVKKSMAQITLVALDNSDTTIWNRIEFSNDMISGVTDALFLVKWPIYESNITAFMRGWALDDEKKSLVLYLSTSGKYRQALIELPGLCRMHVAVTNRFILDVEWYICNCGRSVAEHTH